MTVILVIGLALLAIAFMYSASGGSGGKHDWSGQFTGYNAVTENAAGNRGDGR